MDALLIPTFFCPKPWESMSGSDKERHCSYCNKSVHNLAAMTARERLALLSSPPAKVCSRYVAAIRRPAPGHRESYERHLAKYGVGVALLGSTLLVLWEMHGRSERAAHSRYRVVAPSPTCEGFVPMPDTWYTETEVPTLGILIAMPAPSPGTSSCLPGEKLQDSMDVHLDPMQLENLLKSAPPPKAIDIPIPLPAKKKAGHRPAFGKQI